MKLHHHFVCSICVLNEVHVFPDKWKDVNMASIKKNALKTAVTNYRGTSIFGCSV